MSRARFAMFAFRACIALAAAGAGASVRLPGQRRVGNMTRAAKEGIEIPAELEK